MKTQKQAIEAYLTLAHIGKGVKGQTAFTLYKLKNELKKIIESQSEEEMKVIEKYGGSVGEGGAIKLPDDADKEAYEKDMEELHNLECDVQPVDVKISNTPEITVPQIEALDGFINFIEG